MNTIPTELFEDVFIQRDSDIGTYLLAYNEKDVKYMYKAKKGISFKKIEKFERKCVAYNNDFYCRIYKYKKEEITKEKILAEQKELFEDVFATDLNLI